jgi:cyclic pyranopterin phosphate synthase
MAVLDALQRPLHDLRISVTDRCNFRCTYCMPKEVFGRDYPFIERAQLLSFEEIARVARVFASLGVEKIRLTGGEPLLRSDVTTLVTMLSGIDGIRDLTMTTNGSLLSREMAHALRSAGLHRITISIDAIDDAVFRRLNDVDYGVSRVLAAVDAAAEAGLTPLKVDAVIRRGVNDSQILPIARHFRGTGHIVRFIEFMDVGTTNGWKLDDVVPGAEILRTIAAEWPIEPLDRNYPGEVAERWRYLDGAGEIGVITSVTQPFCGNCTRARISADGQLYTCLFASRGTDLRGLLRSGADDDGLRDAIARVWSVRDDRYSELRSAETAATTRVEMSRIGG